MLKSNRLKQVFIEGKRPAMGFWQMLPGANISRILARTGADWVLVDCEHGNIDGMSPLLATLVPRTGPLPSDLEYIVTPLRWGNA
jgi:2-keto-3-deoxy-L-rhamnonate aldolase RhmA